MMPELGHKPYTTKEIVKHALAYLVIILHLDIVVTYSQFDSNIRIFYVFLGFLKNT
jgi:hypothetical protein